MQRLQKRREDARTQAGRQCARRKLPRKRIESSESFGEQTGVAWSLRHSDFVIPSGFVICHSLQTF
jgi:hypothetical protein